MPKLKETVLLNTKSGKPFVVQKGKKYFIEGIPYTDDVQFLLNAIKNVKEATYNDINKPEHKNSKEAYWQIHFNYQWSGGGLCLWHNPTNFWNQELCRQGKLPCPVCGSAMVMHYAPYCPKCKAKNGLKKMKGKSYYDYSEMEDLIEAKHGIQLRSYHDHVFKDLIEKAGCKNKYEYNTKIRTEWEYKHYPILKEFDADPLPQKRFNQKGMDFYNTPEGSRFFCEMHEKWCTDPEGAAKEIPYYDFWHFMLDYFCGDISNGCLRTVNWVEVKEACKTDWQREIVDLFIAEYGDKEYEVLIEW